MSEFVDKVAIITGASSGIGKATAIELAKRGTKLALANRDKQKGEDTRQFIRSEYGVDAIYIPTDVSIESDVKNLVQKTLSHFGRLDYAFNNAGIEQTPMPLTEQPEELFDKIMAVNVKGVWSCLRHQIPAMLETGGGSVVNTASFSGSIAFATIPLYVASKHAVVGLTKSIALEYAKRNIRVNAVLPGAVENTGTFERSFGTDQASIEWAKSIHPMGRLATPEEIAASVVFLLSKESSFMTGQSLLVDGGYTAG